MEEALRAFTSSGLPGAACVVLAFVIYFLWQETKNERISHARERKEWETKKDELETKRLTDLKEVMQHRIADQETTHKKMLSDQETTHNKMLDVVKQCTSVMEATAASLDGHKDAALEHRDSSREASEELRKLSTLLNSLYDDLKTRFRAPR